MVDAEPDDGPVRWVYLLVLALPMVLAGAMLPVDGTRNAFTLTTYPAILIVHGLLGIGVLCRRLSLRAVGPWVVLSPAVALVARLVTWEVGPTSGPDRLADVLAVLAWFGVVSALLFLVLGTRRGALLNAVGGPVLYLAIGWSVWTGSAGESGTGRVIVYVGAAHAALIMIVWVLARNVEQLAAVRARTDLLNLQATTDPLTGIANRRHLDDELQRLIARAHRYGQPLSVVLADLDHFKDVNDTLGHEVGDRALVAAVNAMLGISRRADLLGRWGGEELLLLAPHTDHAAACALAERCRHAIRRSSPPGEEVAVTASLGVATLEAHDDARALMRRADLAMYTAKSEGRDTVVGTTDVAGPSTVPASERTGEGAR